MNEALKKALSKGQHVDVPDLAEALGVSKHLLYRAIRNNEVRASRIGQRVKIPAHVARELLCLPPQEPIAA